MRELREGAGKIFYVLERQDAHGEVEGGVGQRQALGGSGDIGNIGRAELLRDFYQLRRDVGTRDNRTPRRKRAREKSFAAREVEHVLAADVARNTQEVGLDDFLVVGVVGFGDVLVIPIRHVPPRGALLLRRTASLFLFVFCHPRMIAKFAGLDSD